MNKYILVKTETFGTRHEINVKKVKCYDSFDEALVGLNLDFSDDCARNRAHIYSAELDIDYIFNTAHYRVKFEDGHVLHVLDETIMKETE